MIYPWQQTIWQQLTAAFMNNTLPHAMLFSGIQGIGKLSFVQTLTRYLLCEKRSKLAGFCDNTADLCHACHLIETNVHPSVYYIEPDKAGHAIKIDQIREMTEYAGQSAYLGEYQCIIIHPAHQLNHFAANALLKTLEEPANNVFLFLITDERSRLLATINSRCMHVAMPMPTRDEASSWMVQHSKHTTAELSLALNLAMGAPLRALALLQSTNWKTRGLVYQTIEHFITGQTSLLSSATLLQDVDLQEVLDYLLSWCADAAKLKCGVEMAHIDNADYAKPLAVFAQMKSLSAIDQALHSIFSIRKKVLAGVSLNKTLCIENILLTMERC